MNKFKVPLRESVMKRSANYFWSVTKPEGILFCFGLILESHCLAGKIQKYSLICPQRCSNDDSGGEIPIIA